MAIMPPIDLSQIIEAMTETGGHTLDLVSGQLQCALKMKDINLSPLKWSGHSVSLES